MKKILALSVSILIACFAQAQPWMDNFKTGPVKLQDVIDAWHSTHEAVQDTDGEKGEESDNYQFDRWVNYWKSHTDENGYLVSPQRTIREWSRYNAVQAKINSGGRTTSIPVWSFVGPTASLDNGTTNGNGLGRISAVGYHPTDTNTFWIGTPGGGAWKTTDGGHTWTCMTDNTFPIRGVSDIVFNPLNPHTVYLCTGDRDASDCYSMGVLKSYDGGLTWDTTGLVWAESSGKLASSMVINKLDTNTLVLATNDGIYKSNNGGSTWALVQAGKFTEILYNPIDTNILYAVGGTSANVYRSADGGSTWTQTTSTTTCERGAIAVTAGNPAIVKMITANTAHGLEGFYTSSDTGKTFSRIYNADTSCAQNILSFDPKLKSSSCGGQGWYDLVIAISPIDTNSVYIGGVNTWHSEDGGHTWNIATQWTHSITTLQVVHADKHYLGYNPLTPNYIFEGNDGGIYRSLYRTAVDTLSTYTFDNLTDGMGTTQFYRIAVSELSNFAVGGAQDNGSKQVFVDSVHQSGGADGQDCQVDQTNANIFYISIQYGNPVSKTTDGGKTFKSITKNIGLSGNWTTPFLVDPQVSTTLYVGYNKLYVSTDGGTLWNANPTLPTGANLDRIAVYPFDNTNIYVTAGNQIHYSSDGGTTWTFISSTYGTVTDIAIDPLDAKHIWVTFGGYGINKVADYYPGKGWHLQNGSLPRIPVHCILIDNQTSTTYIGNDAGVFYRDTNMTDWAPYSNGLAVVQVNDLKLNHTTGELWAGTYGRGMWKTALHQPSYVSIVPYAPDVITVAPNPSKGHFYVSTTNNTYFGKTVNTKIFNALGQMVWQGNATFDGSGKLQINADGLAKGPYVFEVANGVNVARTRIIILQ